MTTTSTPRYVRNATVLTVHDGDTYTLRIDLGWSVDIRGDIRLLGVDAPELPTPEGEAAGQWVRDLLDKVGHDVIVTSHKPDPERSFARYLADITLADGTDLATALLNTGHAVPRAR